MIHQHVWQNPDAYKIPQIVTRFEKMLIDLHLKTAKQILDSREARAWIYRHCEKHYVPEYILREMGINLGECDVTMRIP